MEGQGGVNTVCRDSMGSCTGTYGSERQRCLHAPWRRRESCIADLSAARYSTLEHGVVQLCAAPRSGVGGSREPRMGDSVPRRWRSFLRYRHSSGDLGYTGIGFQTSKSYSAAPLPITASEFDFSTTPVAPYTSNNAYIFPSHLQAPYTLEWNAAVQQSLGKSQALTISYVGSSGRRLLQFVTAAVALVLLATNVTGRAQHLFDARDAIEMSRFSNLNQPEEHSLISFSPDGRYFVFVTSRGVWLRTRLNPECGSTAPVAWADSFAVGRR